MYVIHVWYSKTFDMICTLAPSIIILLNTHTHTYIDLVLISSADDVLAGDSQ